MSNYYTPEELGLPSNAYDEGITAKKLNRLSSSKQDKEVRLGGTRNWAQEQVSQFDGAQMDPLGLTQKDADNNLYTNELGYQDELNNKLRNNLTGQEIQQVVGETAREQIVRGDRLGLAPDKKYQQQDDGSWKEFTGKTRRAYMFGTKGDDSTVKFGLARGDFDGSEYRYDPERAKREGLDIGFYDRKEGKRKFYGWDSGPEGVDLNKKLMDIELPEEMATGLEALVHGRQNALNNRVAPDKFNPMHELTYGSGKSEYYDSMEGLFQDYDEKGVVPTDKFSTTQHMDQDAWYGREAIPEGAGVVKEAVKEVPQVELGSVSAKYESSGNKSAVATNDGGAPSYGKYQISALRKDSNPSTMDTFLASEEGRRLKNVIGNLDPQSGEFQARFKQAMDSRHGDKLLEDQQAFIKRTHFDPVARLAEQYGISTNSAATQEMLWSQSVQTSYAGNKEIIENTAARLSSMENPTEADLIDTMYAERAKYTAKKLAKNANYDQQFIQNVGNRYINEKADVLGLIGVNTAEAAGKDLSQMNREELTEYFSRQQQEIAQKEGEEAGFWGSVAQMPAAFASRLYESMVLDTADLAYKTATDKDLYTDDQKAAMAAGTFGYNPAVLQADAEKVKGHVTNIYDAFKDPNKAVDIGDIVGAAGAALEAAPTVLATSIAEIISMAVGPTKFIKGAKAVSNMFSGVLGKGKKVSVASQINDVKKSAINKEIGIGEAKEKIASLRSTEGKLAKIGRVTDKVDGLSLWAAKEVNDQIDAYVEEHGEAPSTEKVASMWVTQTALGALDKIVFMDIAGGAMKALGLKKQEFKDLVGAADAKDKAGILSKAAEVGTKLLKATPAGRVVGGVVAVGMAGGKEYAQEYFQSMGEIFNVKWNFDETGGLLSAESLDKAGELLWERDTQIEAHTGGVLGAGMGGGMQAAAEVSPALGSLAAGAGNIVGKTKDALGKGLDAVKSSVDSAKGAVDDINETVGAPEPEVVGKVANEQLQEHIKLATDMKTMMAYVLNEDPQVARNDYTVDNFDAEAMDTVVKTRVLPVVLSLLQKGDHATADQELNMFVNQLQSVKIAGDTELYRVGINRLAEAFPDVIKVLGSDESSMQMFNTTVKALSENGVSDNDIDSITTAFVSTLQEKGLITEDQIKNITTRADNAKAVGKALSTLSTEDVGSDAATGSRGYLTYYQVIKDAQAQNDEKAVEVATNALKAFYGKRKSKLDAVDTAREEFLNKEIATATAKVLSEKGDNLSDSEMQQALLQELRGVANKYRELGAANPKGTDNAIVVKYGNQNTEFRLSKDLTLSEYIGDVTDHPGLRSYKNLIQETEAMYALLSDVAGTQSSFERNVTAPMRTPTETVPKAPTVPEKPPAAPRSKQSGGMSERAMDADEDGYPQQPQTAEPAPVAPQPQTQPNNAASLSIADVLANSKSLKSAKGTNTDDTVKIRINNNGKITDYFIEYTPSTESSSNVDMGRYEVFDTGGNVVFNGSITSTYTWLKNQKGIITNSRTTKKPTTKSRKSTSTGKGKPQPRTGAAQTSKTTEGKGNGTTKQEIINYINSEVGNVPKEIKDMFANTAPEFLNEDGIFNYSIVNKLPQEVRAAYVNALNAYKKNGIVKKTSFIDGLADIDTDIEEAKARSEESKIQGKKTERKSTKTKEREEISTKRKAIRKLLRKLGLHRENANSSLEDVINQAIASSDTKMTEARNRIVELRLKLKDSQYERTRKRLKQKLRSAEKANRLVSKERHSLEEMLNYVAKLKEKGQECF